MFVCSVLGTYFNIPFKARSAIWDVVLSPWPVSKSFISASPGFYADNAAFIYARFEFDVNYFYFPNGCNYGLELFFGLGNDYGKSVHTCIYTP